MESFLISVPVPSMGATVNEMTLIDLFVSEGDKVTKGQAIAELESDKSAFDFESPCNGSIRKILCRAGDILECEAPFLIIETEAEELQHLRVEPDEIETTATKTVSAPPKKEAVARSKGSEPRKAAPGPATASKSSAASDGNGLVWTPRALRMIREAGLDPDAVTGVPATGPGGRVSGDDVMRFLDSRMSTAEPAPAPSAASTEETVCVAGIGYAVPENIRSNQEILKAFPDMTEEEIIRITGIRQRYYAKDGETATGLAVTATRHALEMAGMKATELDGIILATILPDQPVPSAASALAKELGIEHVLAFDLNAACSGWLYALEIGRAFIRSGTGRNLLVVTAELLSRITNPKDHATAFLFGDGAGAAILSDRTGGHRLNRMALSGDARYFEAIQRTGGGARLAHASPDTHPKDFYLTMDGPVVFKHAVIAFSDIIESTLKRHDVKPEDVAWIVPHQANERILRAVSKRVGIPYERFVVTIGKYGNTSAASVSMALGWAAEEEIFNPGDRIIFCSVGAGFTFAGGLLVW